MELYTERINRVSVCVLAAVLVAFGCACGGGGGSSGGGTGELSLSLTDAVTEAYHAVYVTILEVQVC